MISSIESVLVRAAASSMASGSPSSERHRSRTASPDSPRAARRLNSSTASASASGVSSKTCSPSTSSGTWLVQRMRSAGAASSRRTASAAAASTTCSQLSRITTAPPLSRSISAGSPPVTPVAAISMSRTSSAVVAPSSRASHTAPGSVRPVAIATAVFPIPPGPTISTSRCSSSRAASAAISASRPTSSADSDGRFPAAARSAGSCLRIWAWSCCNPGPGSSPRSSASRARTRW